jgi:DNA topoisomerase-1
VKGPKLRFRFRGKSGRQHEVDMTDRRIAKIVSKCQDLVGQDLFQYVSDEGDVRNITSQDVNDYLREITNENFTAKDFRTWAGTVLAAIALNAQAEFKSKKQAKANIKNAVSAAAEVLGNTPTICRKCYVHPAIIEAYLIRTPIAEDRFGARGRSVGIFERRREQCWNFCGPIQRTETAVELCSQLSEATSGAVSSEVTNEEDQLLQGNV